MVGDVGLLEYWGVPYGLLTVTADVELVELDCVWLTVFELFTVYTDVVS